MKTTRTTIAIIAIAVAITVAVTPTHSTPPDITVMPCSAWTHTQYPVIPPYTKTNECVAADGHIIIAPSK